MELLRTLDSLFTVCLVFFLKYKAVVIKSKDIVIPINVIVVEKNKI
jgi:hypothetical protein